MDRDLSIFTYFVTNIVIIDIHQSDLLKSFYCTLLIDTIWELLISIELSMGLYPSTLILMLYYLLYRVHYLLLQVHRSMNINDCSLIFIVML